MWYCTQSACSPSKRIVCRFKSKGVLKARWTTSERRLRTTTALSNGNWKRLSSSTSGNAQELFWKHALSGGSGSSVSVYATMLGRTKIACGKNTTFSGTQNNHADVHGVHSSHWFMKRECSWRSRKLTKNECVWWSWCAKALRSIESTLLGRLWNQKQSFICGIIKACVWLVMLWTHVSVISRTDFSGQQSSQIAITLCWRAVEPDCSFMLEILSFDRSRKETKTKRATNWKSVPVVTWRKKKLRSKVVSKPTLPCGLILSLWSILVHHKKSKSNYIFFCLLWYKTKRKQK